MVRAATMEPRESRKRMRRLRRAVLENDVARWSQTFLGVLTALPSRFPDRDRSYDDDAREPEPHDVLDGEDS